MNTDKAIHVFNKHTQRSSFKTQNQRKLICIKLERDTKSSQSVQAVTGAGSSLGVHDNSVEEEAAAARRAQLANIKHHPSDGARWREYHDATSGPGPLAFTEVKIPSCVPEEVMVVVFQLKLCRRWVMQQNDEKDHVAFYCKFMHKIHILCLADCINQPQI